MASQTAAAPTPGVTFTRTGKACVSTAVGDLSEPRRAVLVKHHHRPWYIPPSTLSSRTSPPHPHTPTPPHPSPLSLRVVQVIDDFAFFKSSIKPEWEDPANKEHGCLQLRKSLAPEQLDLYWQNMLLALIGATLDPADVIAGARVVDKGGKTGAMYRLELWLKISDVDKVNVLRERLEAVIADLDRPLPPRPQMSTSTVPVAGSHPLHRALVTMRSEEHTSELQSPQ